MLRIEKYTHLKEFFRTKTYPSRRDCSSQMPHIEELFFRDKKLAKWRNKIPRDTAYNLDRQVTDKINF